VVTQSDNNGILRRKAIEKCSGKCEFNQDNHSNKSKHVRTWETTKMNYKISLKFTRML